MLLNAEVPAHELGWVFEQHSCSSTVLPLQQQSPKPAPMGLQVSFMAKLLLLPELAGVPVLRPRLTRPHLAFISRCFQAGHRHVGRFCGHPSSEF